MDQATADQLQRASGFLRAGRAAEARRILVELLRQDPHLEQAWYLLSFALEERRRQIYALKRVLHLDPNNQEAITRLDRLQGASEPESSQVAEEEVREEPAPPAKVVGEQAFIEQEAPSNVLRDDLVGVEEEQPVEEEEKKRRTPCLTIVLVGLLIVVLVGAGLLLWGGDTVQNLFGDLLAGSPATATSAETVQPTTEEGFRKLPPTWTPVATATSTPTLGPTATPTATATPTFVPVDPEVETELFKIQQQVSDLRGLDILDDVENVLLSRAAAGDFLQSMYVTDEFTAQLEDQAQVLVALGLIDPTYDLVNYALNSRADNLGGFYLPEDQRVFIVSDSFGGVEKYIYAHEYDHALVDQHMDISSLGVTPECEGPAQRCKAIRALLEGDAMLVQLQWWLQYAEPDDYQDILDYTPPAQLFPEESPPPYALPDLDFNYSYGQAFVEYLYERGGWAEVNLAYADPPATTEQILHPEKYVAREGESEIPIPEIGDALGDNWRQLESDSLGEWMTYLILGYGVDPVAQLPDDVAASAAAGWGGDQYQVYLNDDSGELVLAVHWLWDSFGDADEFLDALDLYQSRRFNGSEADRDEGSCWAVSDQVSCTFTFSEEVLWLLAPSDTIMDSVLDLYPQFP